MSSAFSTAERKDIRLRMAICGPPGSGKTFSALRLAVALQKHYGGKLAVIDSEFGSSEKYVGESPDGIPFNFLVCKLSHFDPSAYCAMIDEAEKLGAKVLVIDGISQAWDGLGGALDQVDKSSSASSFTAWKDVTPKHREFVNRMLSFSGHLIVTMRSKITYELTKNEKGKIVPVRVGLAPVQRGGIEYEFDVFADIDSEHQLTITKSRCPEIDGLVAVKPKPSDFNGLIGWIGGFVGTSTADSPVTVPPKRASDSQIKRLMELIMTFPDDVVEASLKKRGFQSADMLTEQAATDMIKNLEEAAKQAGLVQERRTDGFCYQDQIEEIKSMAEKAGVSFDNLIKVVKAGCGAESLEKLTFAQAVDVIEKLKLKVLETQNPFG